MTDRERQDLQRLYESWPMERLADAVVNDSSSYQPAAVETMQTVLKARGASEAYLAQIRAQAVAPTPKNKTEAANKSHKGEIFLRRFIAYIIDTVLSIGILTLGEFVLGNERYMQTVWLWILAIFAYHIVSEARYGSTLGKMLLGLRVVNEHLGRCSYRSATVRMFTRVIECYALPVVAGITALSTAKGQRIGDTLAGTFVVRAQDLR
jgi:uncharacterized RDD family membrane protein YckC